MECFSVMSKEVEGRIDPFYYRLEFIRLLKKIKFKIKTLGEIGSVFDGPFGSNLKNEEYVKKGIPLLRVQNIKEGKLFIDNVVFISESKNKELKRSEVNYGDIVITKTGWLGNATIIPKGIKANIRADLAGVRIKDTEIIGKYLAIFIDGNIGKKLCSRLNSGSTRERIVIENMRKLPVPLPPKPIQEKIIQLMEEVYKDKKQKEIEAEKLLDSIDDYVLDKLGIKMPNSEDKMCFVADLEDVAGRRIDAYYHQPKFEDVKKTMGNSKYLLKKVGKILEINSKLENIKDYKEINYVDLSSINKSLGIISKTKKIPSNKAPSRARQKILKGDLLISSLAGSLKSIAVVNLEGDNNVASTGFFIIKKSEDYNNNYFFALFRTSFYQRLLYRETAGAIMSSINKEKLEQIKIPLPPIQIQNKIAEEVRKRLKKAEQLQKEAKEEINLAKQKVEEIILGG